VPKSSSAPSPFARLVKWLLIVAGVLFAVQGGEYGTTDLLRQRTRERDLRHQVDSLQRMVDSLGRYEKAVETDPAEQERIAREEFGMIRAGERLYRFASPDTAR
jgi:cell division protein FtsB